MIIECYGVPGSGKSTITRALASAYGVPEVPKYVSRWRSISFMIYNPLFTLRWLVVLVWSIARSGLWKLFRFKLSVFLTTIGRVQYARSMSKKLGRPIFLDEGHTQRLLSLYETSPNVKTYQKLFNRFPKDVIVVQVMYTGNRFDESRVGTYRSSLGDKYAQNWRTVMDKNFITIAEALQNSQLRVVNYERDEEDKDLSALKSSLQSMIKTNKH